MSTPNPCDVSALRLFPIDDLHDPGGKVRIASAADVRCRAVWGGDRREYRYELHRCWDGTLPAVLFVMMNPSTADEKVLDPTVAWCEAWARTNGYGTLMVGNTFAYRATDKGRLREFSDPVGPLNSWSLRNMADEANLVIFAYGQVHKSLRPSAEKMVRHVREYIHPKPVHALRLAKDGTPWHPLYLPRTSAPFIWSPCVN